jgi:hypothetical protein
MENKVKDQIVKDHYAIYNSDCMLVLPTLDNESIDLSIYSPPFAGLYNYSSSEHDMSNCESKEQFLEQYEFLVAEIARVTKAGRISAVHCTDVFDNTCRLWDFPNEIIRIHQKYGFEYRNRITIWKEPLKSSYAYNGTIFNAQILLLKILPSVLPQCQIMFWCLLKKAKTKYLLLINSALIIMLGKYLFYQTF